MTTTISPTAVATVAGIGTAHPPSATQEELWQGFFANHYAGVAPGLAKRILAKKEARVRFMAGYPAKVVKEFRKLKAKQERELTLRAQQNTGGQG